MGSATPSAETLAADIAEPAIRRDPEARPWPHSLKEGPRAASMRPSARRFLVVLSFVYVAKQLVYVVAFPPFTGHDELAHYSYIRTVATEARLPVMFKDTLPMELAQYCMYALDWCAEGNAVGPQYAAAHPPFYYLLMAPLYWAIDGLSPEQQQYLLRVAAIPFGLATVLLAYLLAAALFPRDAFLAVTVPTLVAFQPQVSYVAAMVNNDIVCIALYSLMLYLVIIGLRDGFPTRTCVLLGAAMGLSLLVKGTALTAVPTIAVAVVLAVGWRNLRGWLARGTLIAFPAAVLAVPWYAFLHDTYGDINTLSQLAKLQESWNRPHGDFLSLLFSRDFAGLRFRETWGEFGWRRIPLPTGMLLCIALPLVIALGGLGRYALRISGVVRWTEKNPVLRPARWQMAGLLMLLLTCVVSYLAVVQFGTQFALTQARYYFPAINAGALLVMLGLGEAIPARYHQHGQAAVFLALFALNLMIFTQYVVPHYWYW
jgi:4-amino-4-deoxy-L-arabinose transferase-like glycosyltransferase